ncbi:unnamed protein product, partial [Heterosigma akashiwo]
EQHGFHEGFAKRATTEIKRHKSRHENSMNPSGRPSPLLEHPSSTSLAASSAHSEPRNDRIGSLSQFGQTTG